jgi:hypothetical protein
VSDVPIVADIEDLAPAEFLMMLSMTSKTGKLSSVWEGHKTLLVLREGSIVYAASPTVRERLGSMLVNRGLVTEEQLLEALERQKSEEAAGLLGSILVDMGAVSYEQLKSVVQDQFEAVLTELLSWEGGVMIFEPVEIPDLGSIHIDPAEVLSGVGVAVEGMLAASLLACGEPADDTEVEEPTVDTDSEPEPAPEAPVGLGQPGPANGDRAVVRSLMEGLQNRSVSLTAEMTLAILGVAGEVAERGILFLVYPRYLSAIGGFGQFSDGGQISGRALQISRAHRSLFTDLLADGSSYRGPVEEIEGNSDLLEKIGGELPDEAVAVALTVGDRVVAVLYCDGGGDSKPVGSIESIETTMAEVAMAINASQSAG